MSAFIVNDNHINVIVSYFVDYRKDHQLWCEIDGQYFYMNKDGAEKVAECLYAENVRSVNSRYDDDQPNDFSYTYINTRQYSVGDIAMALDCLEYQSCEGPDYYTSDAHNLIASMRKHLLKKVADREGATAWEITDVKQGATV